MTGSIVRISRLLMIAASLICAMAASAPAEDSSPDLATLATWPHLTDDWFGVRKSLADRGITFDISFSVDATKNVRGGLDTAGSAWRTLFDPSVELDLKPLIGLEGGTAYGEFQWAQGPNASDELIGDVQGINNNDGVPGAEHQNRTQIAQLWYQQTAFGEALRVKVGKVDANSEFDHSQFAGDFLNQSYGSSATLFTLPTYPDNAFGINVFLKPVKDLRLAFGVYDGSLANGVRTGSMGPDPFFHDHDLFLIGEIDKSWTLGPDQLAGRLAVGGWYSTNKFPRLDGGETSGTGGPYVLLDQSVWRANPKDDDDARGVGVFVMWGYADPSILAFDHSFGGGVAWTGPLAHRPTDVAGIGVQAVHFSQDFHASADFEINYELFYRLQLTPWLAIKPDLQYISNPGGNGTPDALAVTVRLQFNF